MLLELAGTEEKAPVLWVPLEENVNPLTSSELTLFLNNKIKILL